MFRQKVSESEEKFWCTKCGREVPRSITYKITWRSDAGTWPYTVDHTYDCTRAEPGIGSAHGNTSRGAREVAADLALIIERTHKLDDTNGGRQIAPLLAGLETNFANVVSPYGAHDRNRLDELLVYGQQLLNRASAINMGF